MATTQMDSRAMPASYELALPPKTGLDALTPTLTDGRISTTPFLPRVRSIKTAMTTDTEMLLTVSNRTSAQLKRVRRTKTDLGASIPTVMVGLTSTMPFPKRQPNTSTVMAMGTATT